MMNQRVHVGLHRLTVRQNYFRGISFYRSGLKSGKSLYNDLVRFVHFTHPHHISGPNIAVWFCGDLKIVGFITRVGIRATYVESYSAAAQTWTRESPVNGILCRDASNTLRALLKNPVATKQCVKFLK